MTMFILSCHFSCSCQETRKINHLNFNLCLSAVMYFENLWKNEKRKKFLTSSLISPLQWQWGMVIFTTNINTDMSCFGRSGRKKTQKENSESPPVSTLSADHTPSLASPPSTPPAPSPPAPDSNMESTERSTPSEEVVRNTAPPIMDGPSPLQELPKDLVIDCVLPLSPHGTHMRMPIMDFTCTPSFHATCACARTGTENLQAHTRADVIIIIMCATRVFHCDDFSVIILTCTHTHTLFHTPHTYTTHTNTPHTHKLLLVIQSLDSSSRKNLAACAVRFAELVRSHYQYRARFGNGLLSMSE